MTGKSHCTFDPSQEDSEFAEFYDFSGPEDDEETDIEGDDDEEVREKIATRSSRRPLQVDEDSIRLPSGKIISKRSSTLAGPSISFAQIRRRTRTSMPQIGYSAAEPGDQEVPTEEEPDSDVRDTRLISRREKRERAMATYQLTNMSANDRNSLVHLPASQQRSLLVTQRRHGEKVQLEERRRQGKIDRKGNKNLYAYWATETPVYQCG